MTTNRRRSWQAAFAIVLICGAAGLLGSVAQAADAAPAAVSGAESQAIADRLEAMLEEAAARVSEHDAEAGAPGAEVRALRERLEAAETQIKLLKNVVIQALRAQTAAEAALRRERVARRTASVPEAGPDPVGSPELMLSDQLEALTDSVQRLRADVDALRDESSSSELQEGPAASAAQPLGSFDSPEAPGDAAALEEDAMLPESGMGGRYEPLTEDERPGWDSGDTAALAAGDPVKVAEVHFNPGSAALTAGGARRTLEAVERIRSMGAAKVRVVAFADRVGDAAHNRVLSKERALSIAAMLESVGFGRDMVEVVGSGEDDLPVPTADGVPEPLNRCAGIFVLTDSAG